MKSTTNPLKKALQENRVVYGAAVTTDCLIAAGALASVGFDFLFFDLEHGVLDLEVLHHMVAMLRGSNTVPIARVASDDAWQLKRALDTGIRGVIIPFVNDGESAREVVRSCKYPPEGVRGLGCMLAASRWGVTSAEYVAAANREILVVVQVETAQAVESVDDIAATPGVDMIFVGPSDLSADLGVPLDTQHPLVGRSIEQVAAAARKSGVVLGTVAKSVDDIRTRISQGFNLLVVSGDISGLTKSASAALETARRTALQVPATER
jgi:2-keto-3-deoxy-L-rhamnonate aldolase RhmA